MHHVAADRTRLSVVVLDCVVLAQASASSARLHPSQYMFLPD